MRAIPDKLVPCYIVWEKRLKMFDMTTEERKTYKTVLAKLNDYFKACKM